MVTPASSPALVAIRSEEFVRAVTAGRPRDRLDIQGIATSGANPALREEFGVRAAGRPGDGDQPRDRAAVIGDLDAVPRGLDVVQQFTGSLPQFADSHRPHVAHGSTKAVVTHAKDFLMSGTPRELSG